MNSVTQSVMHVGRRRLFTGILAPVVAVAAAVGLWAPAPAGAAPYPPAACELEVGTAAVPPGGTTLVSTSPGCAGGAGFPPACPVTVSLDAPDGVVVGDAITGADGEFSTEVTIPPGTEPGDHQLVATCQGSVLVLGAVVAVSRGGNEALASTGSDTGTAIVVGLAAVVVGALLVVVGRRRFAAAR